MQALIYNIDPFDALIGTTITFNWGGNNYKWIKCIIKNSDFSTEVYSGYSKYGYQNAFVLNPKEYGSSIINGGSYEAYIQVCLSDPVTEDPLVFPNDAKWSDLQQVGKTFKCFETPTFTFTNIDASKPITTSVYDFELVYHQAQGVALNNWTVTLSKVTEVGLQEVDSYGPNYGIGESSYINNGTTAKLFVSFMDFETEKQYVIQAHGEAGTLNNLIKFESDPIQLSVDIAHRNKAFLKLEAVNRAEFGAIRLNSNIVAADGVLKYDPAKFYENTNLPDHPIDYIDLRHNELTYKEGFELGNDFTISVNVAALTEGKEFLIISDVAGNPNLQIKLMYRIDHFSQGQPMGYIDMRVTEGYLTEYFHSNFIDPIMKKDFIRFTNKYSRL